MDHWDNDDSRISLSYPNLFVIWDNHVTTNDFEDIHNVILREYNINDSSLSKPKVIAKDIGKHAEFEIVTKDQIVNLLYTDQKAKYTSEDSDDEIYQLFFKKISVIDGNLEDAKITKSSNLQEMIVSLAVEKDVLKLGDEQKININVIDAALDEPIEGAQIDIGVDYGYAIKKHFTGITDAEGNVSFSWNIGKDNLPGTYSVEADIFADGYEPGYEYYDFEVEFEED